MKTPWIFLAACVASGWLASPARAADPAPAALPPAPQYRSPEPAEWGTSWYLRGDIGWSFDSQPQIGATLTYTGLTPTRQAWVGDLGVGYSINNWLRADVTYGRRQEQSWAGLPSMSHSELLLNAYVDIGTWGGFTPFIGAGAGRAWRGAKNGLGNFQESAFAWAGMIGVAWNLSDTIKLDFGYRYVRAGNGVNTTIAYRKPFESHEVRVGVRYMFD